MTRSVPGPNDAKRLCHKPNTHELDEAVRPVYWKSLEELESVPAPSPEFPGGLPSLSDQARERQDSRRDFLSLMGFTLASAVLAGCRAPEEHAVPSMTGQVEHIERMQQVAPLTMGWCIECHRAHAGIATGDFERALQNLVRKPMPTPGLDCSSCHH